MVIGRQADFYSCGLVVFHNPLAKTSPSPLKRISRSRKCPNCWHDFGDMWHGCRSRLLTGWGGGKLQLCHLSERGSCANCERALSATKSDSSTTLRFPALPLVKSISSQQLQGRAFIQPDFIFQLQNIHPSLSPTSVITQIRLPCCTSVVFTSCPAPALGYKGKHAFLDIFVPTVS